ncbi:MAG: four helix bundle protein [Chitinophagaceae bacterium]
MNYKGYKELESYVKAREFRIDISELVKKFPTSEKFQLTTQIIRSSRSITANIAEGYGRFTYTDTRHFFIIARDSATETMEHLTTAFDEKYIIESELNLFDDKCQTIIKLINGYINFLDKSKATK